MDSGFIGKIEKAKRYAEERDRIQLTSFEASLTGRTTLTDLSGWSVAVHL